MTARQALGRLQREGLIASQQGRGTFVRDSHHAVAFPIEDQLSRPLQAAPIPVAALDAGGNVRSWNAACEQLFGWSSAEVLGSRPPQVPDGRWPEFLASMECAMQGERVAGLESCWQTREGSRLTVTISMAPLHDAAGYVSGVILYALDITGQKQVEEALRQSEERFRTTFDHAAMGLAHTDLNGGWLLINQRLLDLYGYTRDELSALRFQDITHPDDLEADLTQLERLLAGEIDSYSLEKRYLRKDGAVLWAHVTISLAREVTGEPKYIIALVDDIGARKRAEEALRESQARLARIVETIADGVVLHDLEGRITFANPAAEEILGLKRGDSTTGPYHHRDWTLATLDGHELSHEERPVVRTMRSGKGIRDVELVVARPDGAKALVSMNTAPLVDVRGAVVASVTSMRDISQRKQTEEALRKSEERYRRVVEVSPAPIVIHSAGRIRYANRAALTLMGATDPGQILGMPTLSFVHPSSHNQVRVRVKQTETAEGTETEPAEHKLVRLDGQVIDVEVAGMSISYDDSLATLAVLRDITEQKHAAEQLKHQALHDALTGLPNRTLLRDRLQQAILSAQRYSAPLALLLMDLNRFKEVNDTFGHHYGDLLLQQLGARLQRVLRASDTVARLGGDEFAIILPATDAAGAAQAIPRVQAALREPLVVEGQTLEVGASIGIALYPQHGEDDATLLRHADVAMYVAKRGRVDYAVYEPSRDEYTPSRLAMIAELRHAIARDELLLHYQPKIDVKTGVVAHAEALVRWHHPSRGIIPPAQFIPLAEETGLIEPLTVRVLQAALRQCRAWHETGRQVRTAVNLSTRSLQGDQLIETISKLVRTWAVSPARLAVEITETTLMADPDRAMTVLSRLHDMGVSICVDDFGTGYSSLAYLKRLPIDEIKIDRSFVNDMAINDNDAVIVRSVIDLGHNLGLQVTAEGVEDRETWEMLAAMGCDTIQGYYLSPPLPGGDFLSWLSQHQAPSLAQPQPPALFR